jgi:DNA-binding MarR family transcriptional regulator
MTTIQRFFERVGRDEKGLRGRAVGPGDAGMGCANGVGMNAVMFGCKRAYYATLGLTRRSLAKMGLTAARFDLLYVVHSHGEQGALQSFLRRTLGVCASVVSRMLKSLEALGYVTRERWRFDTRQRQVSLTKVGRACIQRGIEQFISWGYAQLAVESVLVGSSSRPFWDESVTEPWWDESCSEPWGDESAKPTWDEAVTEPWWDELSAGDRWWDGSEGMLAIEAAESVLTKLRDGFGDAATLYYPWHPED